MELKTAVTLQKDFFADCLVFFVWTIFDRELNGHGLDPHRFDAKYGFDPSPEEAVEGDVTMIRIPEQLGRRKIFDLSEGGEHFTD